MKLSIRLKFLLVMSGLLILCLGLYLMMALTVFKSDKTKLVFDLNRSQVLNLSSEIEAGLLGVSEKLKLFAQLPSHLQSRMIKDLFSEDSDLVGISLYKAGQRQASKTFTQAQYLEAYGLKKEEFFRLVDQTEIPFHKILQEGEAIWNTSSENAPPLLAFGRLVLLLDQDNKPMDQWVVVGYVKLDRFLKSVSAVKLSEILVATKSGDVLVQKDSKGLLGKPNISKDRFFKEALAAKTRLSVKKIKSAEDTWLVAFAQAFHGKIVVIAKSPEKQAFLAVRQLTMRTLLFGSIVLTLVILAAFLISRSLTHNIAVLAQRMQSVSQGDFTTTLKLKGRDETVALADSFNQMITDLQHSRNALEVMNRELDLKVKQRTKQLEEQNRKVVEAQEALLKTTRLASMGEVAGRAAHEVLNPLTSLLTRAGLLQKRAQSNYQEPLELFEEIEQAWRKDISEGGFDNLVKAWQEPSTLDRSKSLFDEDLDNLKTIKTNILSQSQEITADLSFIRQEGERIGKIVNSMRRLGTPHSDPQLHPLHEILADCCDIMMDLFDQKGFLVERNFAASNDVVLVDRDEVIQAFTNIMRNSLQALDEVAKKEFYPSNKYSMKISTTCEDGNILIDFEDNGSGIDNKNQSQLFESNFTTKASDEGTGFGLNISRRFIRSYGGDMEFVSSQPMVQTLFRIQFPMNQVKIARKVPA